MAKGNPWEEVKKMILGACPQGFVNDGIKLFPFSVRSCPCAANLHSIPDFMFKQISLENFKRLRFGTQVRLYPSRPVHRGGAGGHAPPPKSEVPVFT